MSIMIVGCGRVGSELAQRFDKRGEQVTVVDTNADALKSLPSDFRGQVIEADILAEGVLKSLGIEDVTAIALVTNNDLVNTVGGHIAKTVFKIPSVVVRTYNPHCAHIPDIFGLTSVASASWDVEHLDQSMGGGANPIPYAIGDGAVQVYRCTISAQADSKKLKDVLPVDEVIPVALIQKGKAVLPKLTTTVHDGDILDVSATPKGIADLQATLAGKGGN